MSARGGFMCGWNDKYDTAKIQSFAEMTESGTIGTATT